VKNSMKITTETPLCKTFTSLLFIYNYFHFTVNPYLQDHGFKARLKV